MVVFVGAGPGDPELLTLRAKREIESADTVLHDELVPPAISGLNPRSERYQGVQQLIHAARTGAKVVRLQVGDPTIFGKLTEQMEALDEAGIGYEIVPGVTAATAAAAAARLSLTHRTLAQSVAIVTAHEEMELPNADTVVLYMGRPPLPGRAFVSISNATRPEQVVCRDSYEGIEAPAVTIVGAVADLRRLPLYGKRIVVTRAESTRMRQQLRALGAETIPFPVIEIVAPLDEQPLRDAVERLDRWDWIVFTSANGVRAFLERIQDLRSLRAKLCTIGPATRAELERHKLVVDVVPDQYVAESVVAALSKEPLQGRHVLIPRAAIARDVIPLELEKRGARVTVVEAYRTVAPASAAPLPEHYDWVTFTSSSTVKNFLAIAGKPTGRIASIGPITSETLRRHGLVPDVEAEEYTTDGLIRAILRTSSSSD